MFDEESWLFTIQAGTQTTNLSHSMSKIVNIWEINANKFVTDHVGREGLLHKEITWKILSSSPFMINLSNKIERGEY